MKWPTKICGKKRVNLSIDPAAASLSGGWNTRPINNELIDVAAAGNNGTLVGNPTGKDQLLGCAIHAENSADYINCGDDAALDVGTGDFSLMAWVKGTPTGETYIFAKEGVDPRYYLSWSNSGNTFRFLCDDGSNVAYADSDAVDISTWTHVVATADRSSSTGLTIYIDGQDATASRTGDLTSVGNLDNGNDLTLLRASTGIPQTDLLIPQLYKGRVWSYTDIYYSYLDGAEALQHFSRWGIMESTAAEGGTAGQPLSNTGFKMADSTTRWRVGTDLDVGDHVYKSLYPTVSGYIYKTNFDLGLSTTEMLTGSWLFSFYKDGGSDECEFVIGSSAIGATFNGYSVLFDSSERLRLYRVTGGTGTSLLSTSFGELSLQTWYDIWVTRDYLGSWRLYYKRSIDSLWIAVSTSATDTTYTTALYRQLQASANSRIGWSTISGEHSFAQCLGTVSPPPPIQVIFVP